MTNNNANKASMLTALASGDNWVKLATIGLILVTGGTNFMETRSTAEVNSHEIKRAVEEVHALYPKLNEAVERQKEILAILQNHKQ